MPRRTITINGFPTSTNPDNRIAGTIAEEMLLNCNSIPSNTKNIIMKKSRIDFIFVTIWKLSVEFASANPARNPPISTENPISGELTNAAKPRAHAMLARSRIS